MCLGCFQFIRNSDCKEGWIDQRSGHAPKNEESAKCLWRSFLVLKISAVYVQALQLLRLISLFGPFGMAPSSVRIQFKENLASKAAKDKAAIYIKHMYKIHYFYNNIISHFTKSKANT